MQSHRSLHARSLTSLATCLLAQALPRRLQAARQANYETSELRPRHWRHRQTTASYRSMRQGPVQYGTFDRFQPKLGDLFRITGPHGVTIGCNQALDWVQQHTPLLCRHPIKTG